MTVGRIFTKIYIFISLSWAFFENRKNSGLTQGQNDDRVTRWPGRERWPKWPIDPVPNDPVQCLASAEHCSSDRPRSTKTIPRQPVAEDVTLAARSAEDQLQSGSADVWSPQHIDAVVPPSPNPGSRTRPRPAIDHYDAVSTFHNDHFCEAGLPVLSSDCLELTTENCRQ